MAVLGGFFPNFAQFSVFWAHLSHAEALHCCAASPHAHHDVCECKEHVKTIQVFGKALIHYLGIPELLLHNQECMLYLAADCRFTMFVIFFYVKTDEFFGCLVTARLQIDSETNFGVMLVIDDFRALFQAGIA